MYHVGKSRAKESIIGDYPDSSTFYQKSNASIRLNALKGQKRLARDLHVALLHLRDIFSGPGCFFAVGRISYTANVTNVCCEIGVYVGKVECLLVALSIIAGASLTRPHLNELRTR